MLGGVLNLATIEHSLCTVTPLRLMLHIPHRPHHGSPSVSYGSLMMGSEQCVAIRMIFLTLNATATCSVIRLNRQ